MIKTININSHTVVRYKQAMKIGLIGSFLMVAYLVVIELITGGNSYGLKFLKYIFLAIPMAFGLCKISEGEGFHNPYLPQSTFYTAVIALTAATVVLLSYLITLPIEGINLATITTPVAEHNHTSSATVLPLPIPFMLFLEVFAIGMIIGFALLVYGADVKRVTKRKVQPAITMKKAA